MRYSIAASSQLEELPFPESFDAFLGVASDNFDSSSGIRCGERVTQNPGVILVIPSFSGLWWRARLRLPSDFGPPKIRAGCTFIRAGILRLHLYLRRTHMHSVKEHQVDARSLLPRRTLFLTHQKFRRYAIAPVFHRKLPIVRYQKMK